MSLFISKRMTRKMKGIWSVNTNSLTNFFCQSMRKQDTVCAKCYSYNMLRTTRVHCAPIYQHNNDLLSKNLLPFCALPVMKRKAVRLHAHGELINKTHLLNFFHIAKKNSCALFTLWTKRANIVKDCIQEKPDNVFLVYSTLKIDVLRPKIPKYFDKVFSVYTAKFAADNDIKVNCHGACMDCLTCYSENDTQFINEILKKEQELWEGLHETKGRIHGRPN